MVIEFWHLFLDRFDWFNCQSEFNRHISDLAAIMNFKLMTFMYLTEMCDLWSTL